MSVTNRHHFYFIGIALLYCLLPIGAFAALNVGNYELRIGQLAEHLTRVFSGMPGAMDEVAQTVLLQVRLPRVLLALMVGGALAVSGASYQTLFKNPMVSPGILGVSAGAGVGAAVAMLLNAPWWGVQLGALCFGVLAVLLTSLISFIFGRKELTILVLGGIVVSSFFGALLSVVKTKADTEDTLPSIVFWLMGSLARGGWGDVACMLPGLIMSLLLLFLFRHQINALAAGESEAHALGVNLVLIKFIVIFSSTLMTVLAVSVSGIVGWVGMVVPHMARMLVGADFARLLAVSFALGALFLLGVDSVIRGVPGAELPLGVLTALIGTPLFILMLWRVRKGWL